MLSLLLDPSMYFDEADSFENRTCSKSEHQELIMLMNLFYYLASFCLIMRSVVGSAHAPNVGENQIPFAEVVDESPAQNEGIDEEPIVLVPDEVLSRFQGDVSAVSQNLNLRISLIGDFNSDLLPLLNDPVITDIVQTNLNARATNQANLTPASDFTTGERITSGITGGLMSLFLSMAVIVPVMAFTSPLWVPENKTPQEITDLATKYFLSVDFILAFLVSIRAYLHPIPGTTIRLNEALEEQIREQMLAAGIEPESSVSAPKPEIELENEFEKRLKAIGYTGEIPDWATDPVTFCIMENPVMLGTANMIKDPHDAENVDLATYHDLVNRNENLSPTTRSKFKGYAPNRALKKAIEAWVCERESEAKLETERKEKLPLQELSRKESKAAMLKASGLFGQRLTAGKFKEVTEKDPTRRYVGVMV